MKSNNSIMSIIKIILICFMITGILFLWTGCEEEKDDPGNPDNPDNPDEPTVTYSATYSVNCEFNSGGIFVKREYVLWYSSNDISGSGSDGEYLCTFELNNHRFLPFWEDITKSGENDDLNTINAVTGATNVIPGGAFTSTPQLLKEGITKFTVFFEINLPDMDVLDENTINYQNINEFFFGQPAVVYKTEEIDIYRLGVGEHNINFTYHGWTTMYNEVNHERNVYTGNDNEDPPLGEIQTSEESKKKITHKQDGNPYASTSEIPNTNIVRELTLTVVVTAVTEGE